MLSAAYQNGDQHYDVGPLCYLLHTAHRLIIGHHLCQLAVTCLTKQCEHLFVITIYDRPTLFILYNGAQMADIDSWYTGCNNDLPQPLRT